MSVPAEIMEKAMSAGGGGMPSGAAAPGAMPGTGGVNAGGPAGGGPAAAPLSTPQDKKGLKAAAQTNLHIAVNMLEEALPAFGSESAEGQKILSALKHLGGLVAKKDSSDLVPAEILQMVRQLPQMGGGTDVQKMIMQQMQQRQQRPQAAAGA